MAEQWTDIGIMAEDPAQSLIRGDWGVIQTPKGKGEKGQYSPALNAGFCLGISAKSHDPEAAKAYLLFASRPDIALKLNLINGGMNPTRTSVLISKEYQSFAAAGKCSRKSSNQCCNGHGLYILKCRKCWISISQYPTCT